MDNCLLRKLAGSDHLSAANVGAGLCLVPDSKGAMADMSKEKLAPAAGPALTAPSRRGAPTVFDRAARMFDGWTDPITGVRVLRLHVRGASEAGSLWSTVYHQSSCFLEGGRKVLLHEVRREGGARVFSTFLFDLATGERSDPFPPGHDVVEVRDGTHMASLVSREGGGEARAVLWDMKADREVASISTPGWNGPSMLLLGDHRRGLALAFRKGQTPFPPIGPLEKTRYYEEAVQSRHYLLAPDEPPRLVFEANGYFCNHIQGCPTDPDLYTYNRWPTPKRDVDQVIHLRSLDGRIDEPVPLAADAVRPGDMWGVRDHYVWTPDGNRIVSYLCPDPIDMGPGFNHFKLAWWLSVLDRRTGEDFSAQYPAGRWGGHMQVTPDSRHILCAGGPGFDKLFAVDVAGLSHGWNETILCSYPKTVSVGTNADPFPYPFALPDGSGVIFTAGWPGPDHGVYLAEWPASLR